MGNNKQISKLRVMYLDLGLKAHYKIFWTNITTFGALNPHIIETNLIEPTLNKISLHPIVFHVFNNFDHVWG